MTEDHNVKIVVRRNVMSETGYPRLYQARCSCGWFGVKRDTHNEAANDEMEHRIAENPEGTR